VSWSNHLIKNPERIESMKNPQFTGSARAKRIVFGLVSGTTAIIIILLLIIISLPHQFQPHRPFDLPTLGVCSKHLNREILDRSLYLGTQYMLHNQKPEGNFNYQYDWVRREYTEEENQVRQAAAMWGLALIYQDHPISEVGTAVEKALAFFERNSVVTPDGLRYVVYPNARAGSTGTVALCALTCVDYLRAAGSELPSDKLKRYQEHLDGFLKFLISTRSKDGLWHRSYHFDTGKPFGGHTPYYDGEALLALVKAARYMGRSELKPVIFDAADAGYRHNIQEALQEDPDSSITKGYYQWSSMAFFEMTTSGWPDTDKYGDYVLDLADWMIDVHKTLRRTRNTAYAYEGIIHAYELAVQRQENKRARKFACVIDTGLEKLISWQVGSPIANRFIRRYQTDDPIAIGGVQNHRIQTPLRIDVTQHQMHAIILARKYVYN
jgi:hypothetical protein